MDFNFICVFLLVWNNNYQFNCQWFFSISNIFGIQITFDFIIYLFVFNTIKKKPREIVFVSIRSYYTFHRSTNVKSYLSNEKQY